MEILGGIVLLLVLMPVLAAVGITTLAAFALMMALGLLTNMSFKRLFFVSFAMGLAAPLLLGGAMMSAFSDEGFQRDLRDGFDEIVQLPEDEGGTAALGPVIPRVQELVADLEKGDMSDAEIEARIEGLFDADGPVQIEFDRGEEDETTVSDAAESEAN